MKILEFHISYQCPNDCYFCSERSQLLKINQEFVSKRLIIEKLKKYQKKGFKEVTLTGGEPTLHPDFIQILKEAKNMDYTTFATSNSCRLSSKSFAKKVFPWLDKVSFSLHGFNAKTHNFHTKNPESFSKVKKALSNMSEFGKDKFGMVNIIITPYNIGFLEKIMSFASNYDCIRHILFSAVAPEGNGLKNYQSLSVPLKTIQKKVPTLVEVAKKNFLVLRFFGLPMCVLGGFYRFSNDLYWTARSTIELRQFGQSEFLKVTRSYKPVRKRIKVYKCRNCAARDVCGGVFKEYADRYGTKELSTLNAK